MVKKSVVRSRTKSSLSLALDHVNLCALGAANYSPYCAFTPGWLIGYDGIVAAGYRIAEDLPGLCPHTDSFRTAVARAGEPFSLTVMGDATVKVSGNQFRATIKTFPPDAMHNVQPDRPVFDFTEGVRTAMVEVAKVTSNRNDRVIGSSVYLRQATCVGTDGGTILEAHHGGNLPGRWLLPREFVEALSKVKYLPTHCGWSDETFTVWFGPNAWLRSNVYQEAYPDTDVIFANMIAQGLEYRPVPTDLLLALETLKPFLVPGRCVTMRQHAVVVCDPELTTPGASYNLEHHMPYEPLRALPWDGLRFAAAHGQWVGFNRDGFYWYGQVLRGATASAT